MERRGRSEYNKEKKISAVIDTNILISSMFWKGAPYKIIELIIEDKIDAFVSKETMKELVDVLKKDFQTPNDIIEEELNLVNSIATIIDNYELLDVVRDEKDNHVLSCAIKINADYIITGDNDLLELKQYENTRILKANEFLKLDL